MRRFPPIREATATWRSRTHGPGPTRPIVVAVLVMAALVTPTALAVTPLPPCVSPPAGMVAWYPLDEPTGATTTADIAPPPDSVVNNAGTATPGPLGPPGPGVGPWPITGRVGGAHYFYPAHFHSVAPQAELDFGTGDFSIDGWIHTVGNSFGLQPIVDKLDTGSNTGFSLYVENQALKLHVNGATFTAAVPITGGNPLANTGPWHHVAATVARSTGSLTLYVNGANAGTFVPPVTNVTNALPLWIGETRLPNVVGEIAVDELEIFSRALSAQEVAGLYAAGAAGKCRQGDLGDAPDTTNHGGVAMTTYATGVTANFPTVYDPASPGPAGPRHDNAKGLLWLGADVTLEHEADVGPDQDPTNNLVVTVSPPLGDQDRRDDGVGGVPLPDCGLTQFQISATNAAATPTVGYVNVWFDWTRDGDWDDLPRCAPAPNVDALAPEWAVQNQAVLLPASTLSAFASDMFRSINPAPGLPVWMRITLTSTPIDAANHGGPFPNPADLGRGGSGPVGGYPFGETEDHLLDVVTDTTGLVDVAQGKWYLRNSAGTVTSFYYGNPGDLPISGDWDGNGTSTPGLYRQSDGFFYARNSNTQGIADAECFAGDPADVPVVGDWDGDGDDNLGLYRPSEQRFYLFTTSCTGSPMGAAQIVLGFGNPGDKPVAGDWDGDGIDEVGLHRESTGYFYWRNTLDTGIASGQIFYGDPNDRFVSGDWGTVDGIDTPAIFRPSDLTYYLRHTLSQGPADGTFTWTGAGAGWLPVSGSFGLG
jgi:hypothetical protein